MKKKFYTGRVAVALLAAACGSGSGGDGGAPENLGLFNENVPAGNTPGTTDGNSQALSVGEMAMGTPVTMDNSDAGGVGKSLALFPAFELFGGLLQVGKSAAVNDFPNCSSIDANNIECKAVVNSPGGGLVKGSLLAHLIESSETHFSGTVQMRLDFDKYVHSAGLCSEALTVSGIFGCDMEVEARRDDSKSAHFRLTGLCNTAEDDDRLLTVAAGDKTHNIGYDLTLNHDKTLALGQGEKIGIKDLNVQGNVFIDGAVRSYTDVKTKGAACQ